MFKLDRALQSASKFQSFKHLFHHSMNFPNTTQSLKTCRSRVMSYADFESRFRHVKQLNDLLADHRKFYHFRVVVAELERFLDGAKIWDRPDCQSCSNDVWLRFVITNVVLRLVKKRITVESLNFHL